MNTTLKSNFEKHVLDSFYVSISAICKELETHAQKLFPVHVKAM